MVHKRVHQLLVFILDSVRPSLLHHYSLYTLRLALFYHYDRSIRGRHFPFFCSMPSSVPVLFCHGLSLLFSEFCWTGPCFLLSCLIPSPCCPSSLPSTFLGGGSAERSLPLGLRTRPRLSIGTWARFRLSFPVSLLHHCILTYLVHLLRVSTLGQEHWAYIEDVGGGHCESAREAWYKEPTLHHVPPVPLSSSSAATRAAQKRPDNKAQMTK